MFLLRQLTEREIHMTDKIKRYQQSIYNQWLRVYMRSKMIKHNKDLFECVDDRFALLDKLRLY